MRNVFRFLWVVCLVFAVFHLLSPMWGKQVSWPLEILAISAVILIPFFLYQGWGQGAGRVARTRGAAPAPAAQPPRAPVDKMLLAVLLLGGAAIASIIVFAFTGNVGWAKSFIIFALLAAAAITAHYNGASYLGQMWAEIWLTLSLVWILWVAIDFQSWTEFILPVLSFAIALIVVLGATGTVAKAIAQGMLWVGKVAVGKEGKVAVPVFWTIVLVSMVGYGYGSGHEPIAHPEAFRWLYIVAFLAFVMCIVTLIKGKKG